MVRRHGANGSDKPADARGLTGILGFKMINDPVNNLHIKLLEGPDSLISFAPFEEIR